jgi:hypothetical protein
MMQNCIGVVLLRLWFPKKSAPITYSAPETTPKNHKKIWLVPGLRDGARLASVGCVGFVPK